MNKKIIDTGIKVGKTEKENWGILKKALNNELFQSDKEGWYTGKLKITKDTIFDKEWNDTVLKQIRYLIRIATGKTHFLEGNEDTKRIIKKLVNRYKQYWMTGKPSRDQEIWG